MAWREIRSSGSDDEPGSSGLVWLCANPTRRRSQKTARQSVRHTPSATKRFCAEAHARVGREERNGAFAILNIENQLGRSDAEPGPCQPHVTPAHGVEIGLGSGPGRLGFASFLRLSFFFLAISETSANAVAAVKLSVTVLQSGRNFAMKRCDSAKLPIARIGLLLLNSERAGFGLENNHRTICWRFPGPLRCGANRRRRTSRAILK